MKSLWARLVLGLTLTATLPTVAGGVRAAVSAQTPPQATVPTLVRITGQLTTSTGEPRTWPVVMIVSVYADQLDSTPLWTEQQIITPDSTGRYIVFAGGTQTDGLPRELLMSRAARWIGVGVQGEAEQPRVMLVNTPYALKALDADTLAGRPLTDFVLTGDLPNTVNLLDVPSGPEFGTQTTFSGGTLESAAAIFRGAPELNDGRIAFSFVPAEAFASSFNLVGGSYPNQGDTRTNQVFRLGANVGVACLQNSSDAAIYDSWESHYAPNDDRFVERIISFSPANCGPETRLWFAQVNKATGYSFLASVADQWTWSKRTDGSVFMYLSPTDQSVIRGSLDLGPSTAGASGHTFSVFNGIGPTSVLIRAGASQQGNLFTVARNNNVPAFYVDKDFDVYATGYVNTSGIFARGDSFSENLITNGYAVSLRANGSLNLRNSAGSAGIRFSSGTHEYDSKDVGIVRGAPGLLSITDGSDGVGSVGAYRDLRVRAVKADVGDFGSVKATLGVTIMDRATGQPVCVYSENGVLKSAAGVCGGSF
jgi:hypothetical protein